METPDSRFSDSLMNEKYPQPMMPEGAEEGILRGMYRVRPAPDGMHGKRVRLLGSGAILNEVLKAETLLFERYGVAAEVWSVTSYKELHKDASEVDRWNRLHPNDKPRVAYVRQCLQDSVQPTIAASDYIKALGETIRGWIPGPYTVLGTDGFGRSDTRKNLRHFFEIDRYYITVAAIRALAMEGKVDMSKAEKAIEKYNIDPEKPSPITV